MRRQYYKEIEEIGIREVYEANGRESRCISEDLSSICTELY